MISAAWRPALPLTARSRERWPGDAVALAVGLCVLLLGIAGTRLAAATIVGGAGAGALLVMQRHLLAGVLAGVFMAALVVFPAAPGSIGHWSLAIVLAGVAVVRERSVVAIGGLPQGAWVVAMVLATLCLALTAVKAAVPAMGAVVLAGSAGAVLIGARLTQRLAATQAGAPDGGLQDLSAITRHLLLGRITGGMLHDLSQPLNVISMANGNLAYIVEHLDIGDEDKRQLLERIERIAVQTDRAADILALFRSLGRDGARDDAASADIRDALNRAMAATHSSLRHPVTVTLEGEALDRPVQGPQATLELLAVAVLLSALGAFLDADRRLHEGSIVFRAEADPSHIVVAAQCFDEAGGPLACKPIDDGGYWLLQQLSFQAGGTFQCLPDRERPARLVLRLGHGPI